MKYKLKLFVILLIAYSTTCYSQKLSGYGLKLGIVAANQTWNYAEPSNLNPKTRTGLGVGGFIEYSFKPGISFVIELDYQQKGFTADVPDSSTTVQQVDSGGGGSGIITQTKTIKPRADYLTLPVTVKFMYNSDMISPYAFAGPHLDYLIGRNGDGAVFDNFHKWDFGIMIGGGFGIYTQSNVSGFFEIRYSPSLVKVFSNDQVSVKNSSFEVYAGIKLLPEKKKVISR